jgi:hypothetical protein
MKPNAQVGAAFWDRGIGHRIRRARKAIEMPAGRWHAPPQKKLLPFGRAAGDRRVNTLTSFWQRSMKR